MNDETVDDYRTALARIRYEIDSHRMLAANHSAIADLKESRANDLAAKLVRASSEEQ